MFSLKNGCASNLLFLVLFIGLPGLIIYQLYSGIRDYQDLKQLEQRGISDFAKVLDTSSNSGEESDDYYIHYQLPGAKKKKEWVFFHTYRKYNKGDLIEVTTLPNRPSVSRIKETPYQYGQVYVRIFTGIFLILVFLILAYIRIKNKKS